MSPSLPQASLISREKEPRFSPLMNAYPARRMKKNGFNHKRKISGDKRSVLHLPKGYQFDKLTAGRFITPSRWFAIYALSRSVQICWIHWE
jgi:hypothetical protein